MFCVSSYLNLINIDLDSKVVTAYVHGFIDLHIEHIFNYIYIYWYIVRGEVIVTKYEEVFSFFFLFYLLEHSLCNDFFVIWPALHQSIGNIKIKDKRVDLKIYGIPECVSFKA